MGPKLTQPGRDPSGEIRSERRGKDQHPCEQPGHNRDLVLHGPIDARLGQADANRAQKGPGHPYRSREIIKTPRTVRQEPDAGSIPSLLRLDGQQVHGESLLKGMSQDVSALILDKGVDDVFHPVLLVHHVLQPQEVAGEHGVHRTGSKTLYQSGAAPPGLVLQGPGIHGSHYGQQQQGHANENAQNAYVEFGAETKPREESHADSPPYCRNPSLRVNSLTGS